MNFDTLKERYDNGRITITMLNSMFRKGIITAGGIQNNHRRRLRIVESIVNR